MVKEQAMNICSKEMKMFIKERKPKDNEEFCEMAERYLEIHSDTSVIASKNPSEIAAHRMGEMSDKSKIQSPEAKRSMGNVSQVNSFNGKVNASSNVKCYSCNRIGHIARNCLVSQVNSFNGKVNASSNVKCYSCNRIGHIARNCKLNGDAKRGRTPVKENMRIGAVTMNDPENEKGKDDVTVGACILDGMHGSLPLVKGNLYGRRINVLRDTGCDGAILNRKYCPEDKFTGHYMNMQQIH
jgi:hypothetical protein